MKKAVVDKIIETAVVRLSADETRTIMKAHVANKPIESYNCNSLAELGVLRRIKKNSDAQLQARTKDCWARTARFVASRNADGVRKAMQDLSEIKRAEDGTVFELTDLGKQIARGITVRMSTQYGAR